MMCFCKFDPNDLILTILHSLTIMNISKSSSNVVFNSINNLLKIKPRFLKSFDSDHFIKTVEKLQNREKIMKFLL